MQLERWPAEATHLHHPHQGFGIFLKDSLKSQGWKPEDSGWDGSAGRHSFVGCGVALQ